MPVAVGPEETLFHVHVGLLNTLPVEFLARLYEQQTPNGIPWLAQVDTLVFRTFIPWLYQGVLIHDGRTSQRGERCLLCGNQGEYWDLRHLFIVYLFARDYCLDALKEDVVNEIMDSDYRQWTVVDTWLVRQVYAHLDPEEALSLYVIATLVHHVTNDRVNRDSIDELHGCMKTDVLLWHNRLQNQIVDEEDEEVLHRMNVMCDRVANLRREPPRCSCCDDQ